MSLEVLLRDLLAFVVQGTLLTLAAAGLARLLPLEPARLKLAWWQAVLVAALTLPVLGPRTPASAVGIDVLLGEGPTRPDGQAPGGGPFPWAEGLAAVLAAGVVLRTIRLVRGAVRLRHCRTRSAPVDAAALEGLADEVGARADVRWSTDAAVPATFGLRRPVVLLPAHVREMPSERLRAVVAHELVHVRRRDWPRAVAEEALGAVLWFHPGVSLALRRLRLAREECVDAAAVAVLGGRRDYLESLLEVARRRLLVEAVPAALFLGEGHLAERVEALLKEVAMSKKRILGHLALSGLVLVLAGGLSAWSFPLTAAGEGEKGDEPAAAAKSKGREPKLIHKVNPVYPPEAKKDGIQGLVHVDARLGKDGAVAEARATDGHPTLAEAALAAVRQWRYEPVLGPDDKPVEARLTITINFRLD